MAQTEIPPGASDQRGAEGRPPPAELAAPVERDVAAMHLPPPELRPEAAPAAGVALGEAPVAAPAASSLLYYVDTISDQTVDGWVMAPGRPSHRCVVGLKVGGEVLARTVASRFRGDLADAGIGDGCHAFSLELPRPLLDGEEHVLELVDMDTGEQLTAEPIRWRSTAGTAGARLTKVPVNEAPLREAGDADQSTGIEALRQAGYSVDSRQAPTALPRHARIAPRVGLRVLFDVSDLVYHIGHRPNLTGIQRVQSSIILSIIAKRLLSQDALLVVSFNLRTREWSSIPVGFFSSLLKDLLLPVEDRLVAFSKADARDGILPGASPFDGVGTLDGGGPSVLCLLGAGWALGDYLHRVSNWKRQFGTRLVMTIHDLISIYARETCDEGTAIVFEAFIRRALRHTDRFLCVSECTARDLRRYAASLSLPEPPITVTQNGSSFAELLPAVKAAPMDADTLPERYVLFVATIEARKNHRLMLEVWRRMLEAGEDPPHLVCVGVVGWKADAFIAGLVETNYLDGKVVLLKEVSDAQLKALYKGCLFTVFPSFYEGWGLPVSEALAEGKVCVCSDRASLPEVAGDVGVYIDIDDIGQCLSTIRGLVNDPARLAKLEAKVRSHYEPVSWASVAERVVAACQAAAEGEPRNPFVAVPYSTEISFAAVPRRESAGVFGEELVARITEARRGYFLYEPLNEESFLRGEDARFGNNWSQPENWGAWLCHGGGEIAIGLPPSDATAFYIHLRLRVCPPLAASEIQLFANAEAVWAGTVGSRPRNVTLRIKQKAHSLAPWRLRLRAQTQFSPEIRQKLASIDGRMPAIGFERLVVTPETDLKGRVDVLSRLAD